MMSTACPAKPDVETVEKIAGLYKQLVVLAGAQLALNAFTQPARGGSNPALQTVILVVVLAALAISAAFLVITTYRLMSALQARAPFLWALGAMVPLLNLLVLLVVSYRARAWCQRFGIQVGLLGPTRESIDAFRSAQTERKRGKRSSRSLESHESTPFSWGRALLHAFGTMVVLGALSALWAQGGDSQGANERAREAGRAVSPIFFLALGVSYLVQTRRRA
jgi:hypothetical protein